MKKYAALPLAAILVATLAVISGVADVNAGQRLGKMFERMDSNGDGVLSAVEAEAAALSRFEKMDEKGDGVITKADISAMALARFQKADLNSDGEITHEEAKAAREAWRKEHHDHN